ncbi:uncharacterized protein BO95DRAFT_257952 [Aspergillus brunneoviolaceus CBS 621.78]|uniref:Uncharacterized protein n=1 Tax=Aspergillus brunneoviolaceus CBS 621.78 TaxID=1450534 RepID=A0ACD1FXF7_9EURO|nr:hypothetical protein BO95DRAFT_257952 [Aspergillus brunneoviolaceus CBS 621.78]RAH41664.1 hypothetical protein BO95DRAFT_257952 [Aspergillus brunneoviolaceus CBS 621.78]
MRDLHRCFSHSLLYTLPCITAFTANSKRRSDASIDSMYCNGYESLRSQWVAYWGRNDIHDTVCI